MLNLCDIYYYVKQRETHPCIGILIELKQVNLQFRWIAAAGPWLEYEAAC